MYVQHRNKNFSCVKGQAFDRDRLAHKLFVDSFSCGGLNFTENNVELAKRINYRAKAVQQRARV